MISASTKIEILERKRGGCIDGTLMKITHGFLGIESQQTRKVTVIDGIPPPGKQSFFEMETIEDLEPLGYVGSVSNMEGTRTTYTFPVKNKSVIVFDWTVFSRKK